MSKETCMYVKRDLYGRQACAEAVVMHISYTYHHLYKETYDIIEKRPIISNETCMIVKRDLYECQKRPV